jgi:hypothetical protein
VEYFLRVGNRGVFGIMINDIVCMSCGGDIICWRLPRITGVSPSIAVCIILFCFCFFSHLLDMACIAWVFLFGSVLLALRIGSEVLVLVWFVWMMGYLLAFMSFPFLIRLTGLPRY